MLQVIQFKSTIFYANLDHKTVTSQYLIFFLRSDAGVLYRVSACRALTS